MRPIERRLELTAGSQGLSQLADSPPYPREYSHLKASPVCGNDSDAATHQAWVAAVIAVRRVLSIPIPWRFPPPPHFGGDPTVCSEGVSFLRLRIGWEPSDSLDWDLAGSTS